MVNKTIHISPTPKAFNVDNPVQTKCSSGYEPLSEQELRSSSTPTELVGSVLRFAPSCTSFARGYPY